MTAIPDELIEQVRDAADIVHLVGEYVDLKRSGSDYRGPCPFHGGTHRNFAVIPKKQMFYCFVCHEGGDVFTFLMKKFGMEYPAAVREVAGRMGITIPERATGGADPREPLFSAVALAADWYAEQLREAPVGEGARRYLAARGFDRERLLPTGLGFAPKGRAFGDAMAKLGIGEDVLLDAGLVVRREDGAARPRFWGRLLFPIHDLRGRIVGFGGRVIAAGEPKYLNSPDSEIFHKGRLLYNLHHAKNAIRRTQDALVVEGYFDVLRLVEHGLEHTVAPLGTALTADQAALLKRYTPQVTLLYDSDTAGLRATFRAADELLRVGARVLVATLPPGKDPDTVIVDDGSEALQAILADALDVFERKLQLLERKGWLAHLASRRRALDRLLSTLRAAKDPVTRDLYVSRAAQALGVTDESIRREIAAGPGRESARRETRRPVPGAGGQAGPEWDLIRVMLREPPWRPRIAEQLEKLELPHGPERELLQLLVAMPPAMTSAEILQQVEGDQHSALAGLLAEPWGWPNVDAAVEGALRKLEYRAVKSQLEERKRQFTVAPESDKAGLLPEINSLSRKARALHQGHWNVTKTGRG